jgi:Tfp pilus assembly protein PilE
MKNSINKKWFTLVELIIVITILVILATIAFISFQGYSAESRDAKVKAEIWNMRNVMEVEMAKWISPLNFITDTGSNLAKLDLNWTWILVSDNTKYKAWNISKTLFNTTTQNIYKMWATPAVYQFAWKLTSNNAEIAYVLGNFVQRTNAGSWVGYFRIWDYVKSPNNAFSWILTSVSTDKSTVYLWSNSTWASNVTLMISESGWLIKDSDSGDVITDGSTTALPF